MTFEPLVLSIAPPVMVNVPVPMAESWPLVSPPLLMFNWPEERIVPPVYVFFPVRANVPPPNTDTLAEPAILPVPVIV